VGLNLSAARSLSIFGNDVKVPSLLEFKHLRVLGFEYCKQVQDHHLAGIGNLHHLKYLRLNLVQITKFQKKLENYSI
jgi:disease resistance protein RPM1